MSLPAAKITLTLLTGVGAVVAASTLIKPSRTQGIAGAMRLQMDGYNADVERER